MRPASAAETRLAGWLQRLVALLQAEGGALARQFRAVVQGRCAVLQLDAARLLLRAGAGAPFEVSIEPADAADAPHVRSSGDALRDVIDGRSLLDAVIADGRLDVRAALPDLLAFHELVQRVLALGTRHAALQALWAEFDAEWPGRRPRELPLDEQPARHGVLRGAVPPSVQQARSPLRDRGEHS